jgi:hypothetical protein
MPERCPSCGAATAPTADWCGLCYAPINVADQVMVTGASIEVRGPSSCHRRGRHVARSPAAEHVDDQRADLDEAPPVSLVRDVSLPALTAGKRVGVMVGGALALMGVLLGFGWGVGSLL